MSRTEVAGCFFFPSAQILDGPLNCRMLRNKALNSFPLSLPRSFFLSSLADSGWSTFLLLLPFPPLLGSGRRRSSHLEAHKERLGKETSQKGRKKLFVQLIEIYWELLSFSQSNLCLIPYCIHSCLEYLCISTSNHHNFILLLQNLLNFRWHARSLGRVF